MAERMDVKIKEIEAIFDIFKLSHYISYEHFVKYNDVKYYYHNVLELIDAYKNSQKQNLYFR